MTREIVRRPRLKQDLAEHYAFIAQDKIEPAERLLIMAEEAFDRLAHTPAIGLSLNSKSPILRGIYFYPMPSPYRNYLLFYRVTDTRLELIALLHGARSINRVLRSILKQP